MAQDVVQHIGVRCPKGILLESGQVMSVPPPDPHVVSPRIEINAKRE
eukprot:CAMPEP_0184389370 /NCGR_PEP_ID=MMETSP0007-20130409/12425_1 /TAXON_ID=97485 /ORGANISM="Prymnesium parvum, Strain Texoma1" /LENGTH=46 /DNA_ID= /DNA_START= /DNA_END= /DNA_ORIENTATION=